MSSFSSYEFFISDSTSGLTSGFELSKALKSLLLIEIGALISIYGYMKENLGITSCYVIILFSVIKDLFHLLGKYLIMTS